MNWEQIVGQKTLKSVLQKTIEDNRVGHAQLFIGKDGYGTLPLALAFAKEIFAKENPHSASKVDSLNHLDLHFSFPVFKTNSSGVTQSFQEQFREMLHVNPYFNIEDWSAALESENKNLTIYADEINDINEKFALKSFEGGSKFLIIWHADQMNVAAANKFLKFLEEPPAKTYIILIAESTQDILPTILSRTQIVEVPRISDEDLAENLTAKFSDNLSNIDSIVFQAQGNWSIAQKLLATENADVEFEDLFIRWVREAFQVKKKPEFLKNIILWSRQISQFNKEKQKNFLAYCAEIFRLALLQNYGNDDLIYKKIGAENFKWSSFSKYIHGANIQSILEEISEADYHLERNGNAKIIWADLGIKLSRYLHRST